MNSSESANIGQATALNAADESTLQAGRQTVDRSAGELLRAAREAAGLHIAALAVMLKVPVKKLEALEASRFDLLPDVVFVRALASSVCRTLKVDPAPVLERLPQTGTPQLVYQGSGVNTPFRSPGDSPGPSTWSSVPKPAAAAVLLLLLASAVILFWPAVSAQLNPITSAITARLTASSASTDIAPGAARSETGLRGEKELASVSPPSAVASGAGAAQTGVPASQQPATSAVTASSTVAAAATVTEVAPATGDVPANSIIVFRAVGESWVEVTDAKRQTVLRRTLTAGESVGVVGALPLSATVGRASMTQVAVRGQGFDLAPWSKDNVARFEVK